MFLEYRQAYITSIFLIRHILYIKMMLVQLIKLLVEWSNRDLFDENKEYTVILVGYYESGPRKIYLKGKLIRNSSSTLEEKIVLKLQVELICFLT